MSSENEQCKDDQFFEKSGFFPIFRLYRRWGTRWESPQAEAGRGEGGDAYPNPGAPHPIAPIIRSYPGETVASRPICETKHQWVDSVLRWGTTRESSMVNVLPPFGASSLGHSDAVPSHYTASPDSQRLTKICYRVQTAPTTSGQSHIDHKSVFKATV